MFLNEVYVITQISNGGISYSDLRDMDFNDYEVIVKITKPIAEKISQGHTDG